TTDASDVNIGGRASLDGLMFCRLRHQPRRLDAEDVRRGLRLPCLRLSDGVVGLMRSPINSGLGSRPCKSCNRFSAKAVSTIQISGMLRAGFVETGDKAELERVGAGDEDDRNGPAGSLGREHCWWPERGHHGRMALHEISRHCRQCIITVSNPAVFD